MKSFKKISSLLIASLFALFALAVSANQTEVSSPATQSLFCKLLPFMCGVSTLGNGDGEIPPKPVKES